VREDARASDSSVSAIAHLVNAAPDADSQEMRVARMIASGLVASVGLGLGLLTVASFGALASGDTGDMSISGVVGLGLFYGLLTAAVLAGAWKLWPRRHRTSLSL
jgi:hypothetical protein